MPYTLRLPATSANLGPGFDALGLAMDFALHIEADVAEQDSIAATGRNVAQCGDVADSLVLQTYRDILAQQGQDVAPLSLKIHNEIPLGMGCGSSAAALVAGVALANHFGKLQWSREKVMEEASIREGHPDNVAACVLGGLTVSSMDGDKVAAISVRPGADWKLLLVMPDGSLSTTKARAMLPESYSRADAVANIQAVSLLTAAFAAGRGDLLAEGMRDRIHQPYRAAACTLLPKLLPLAGQAGILGVALSGAGPAVLLIVDVGTSNAEVTSLIASKLSSGPEADSELFWTSPGSSAEF